MMPELMAQDARDAITAGSRMTLTLPRGAQRKLPGFPRGELLCESYDGRKVYSYDPKRILAWLEKSGLIGDGSQVPPNTRVNASRLRALSNTKW